MLFSDVFLNAKTPFWHIACIDSQILLKSKMDHFIPPMPLGFFTLFEMSLDSFSCNLKWNAKKLQSNFPSDNHTHIQKELPDVFSLSLSNLLCFQCIQLKIQRNLFLSVLTFYFSEGFSPACSAPQLDLALDESFI